MSHPQDLSLRDQAAAIASGDLDPAELLRETLTRIEERDGELNSIVARFPEESEQMLDQAPEGPLHGVPVAVKDMFALPWRAPRDGTDHEQIPAAESALFRLLRDAGAVVVGVTNMHRFGAGTTGADSTYGPAGNPWDVSRCAGGSSGGSAAAVGARLVAGAIGTDGGGSVRLPSAYCGVTGLKGGFGAMPFEGFTHEYSTMDGAGPLCRDAADARLLGAAVLRPDLSPREDGGLRVGLVRSPFWEDLDPEVNTACTAALDAAAWERREVEVEGVEHAQAATILRLTLETLPNAKREHFESAGPLWRALGRYQLLLPADGLVRADRIRAQLRRSLATAFGQMDLLAWPTVPAPAPPLENPTIELPSGPAPADPPNVRQTGLGNLTGVPGISVPVGLHSSGVPIGLQLLAPWGGEGTLLDAAEHLENATDRQHVDALPPIAAGAAA